MAVESCPSCRFDSFFRCLHAVHTHRHSLARWVHVWQGSSKVEAESGTYIVPVHNATYGTAAEPCEPGHYCHGGIKVTYRWRLHVVSCSRTEAPPTPPASLSQLLSVPQRACLPGHFGCSSRLSTPECNGKCIEGYYCDEGSTSNTQHACGSAAVYVHRTDHVALALFAFVLFLDLCFVFLCVCCCFPLLPSCCFDAAHGFMVAACSVCPLGSSAPVPVPSRHYSLGGRSPDVRSRYAVCPLGHYCVDGIKVGRWWGSHPFPFMATTHAHGRVWPCTLRARVVCG